jgi:hypothetical protein
MTDFEDRKRKREIDETDFAVDVEYIFNEDSDFIVPYLNYPGRLARTVRASAPTGVETLLASMAVTASPPEDEVVPGDAYTPALEWLAKKVHHCASKLVALIYAPWACAIPPHNASAVRGVESALRDLLAFRASMTTALLTAEMLRAKAAPQQCERVIPRPVKRRLCLAKVVYLETEEEMTDNDNIACDATAIIQCSSAISELADAVVSDLYTSVCPYVMPMAVVEFEDLVLTALDTLIRAKSTMTSLVWQEVVRRMALEKMRKEQPNRTREPDTSA